jgi:hypothetical protein
MLIDKGFSQNDIISMKLVSGEELIARFEKESPDDITVSKPLSIVFGNNGPAMVPWIFLGEKETYTIKKTFVMAAVPAQKASADQYIQGTTGIALR